MSGRIAYTRPSITALERAYVEDAIATGWGERCYDYLHRFERAFVEHLGVRHAIATSSATGAMQLSLAGLGIGAGDEVILADTNWIATAAPIVHAGAVPVLVDILPDTWCIDPTAVARAVTPRTRAIIATHLYGNLCDMDALRALAEAHGIVLIEDAAEAIGSVWRGQRAGAMGRVGTFSFHGTKTLTTGEGGMLVTNDDALAARLRMLGDHGRSPSETRQFWPSAVGFKFKMSNLQAALGCAQLERVEELVARKRAVLDTYRGAFAPYGEVAMNPEPGNGVNGAWMPTVVFTRESGITRERLIAAFRAADIDARVMFWPLSSTGLFTERHATPIAADVAARAINLPSYHDMTMADQDRVIAVIRSLCEAR
jgi:perosamine synthetase